MQEPARIHLSVDQHLFNASGDRPLLNPAIDVRLFLRAGTLPIPFKREALSIPIADLVYALRSLCLESLDVRVEFIHLRLSRQSRLANMEFNWEHH